MDSAILRLDPSQRVGVSVRHLTVAVKGGSKILDNISFDLEQGNMLAIMGGSGSGKTTLLNTLSQRLNHTNKKLEFTGVIDYVSENSTDKVKNLYLQQTDVFLPGLTLFETLWYQSQLRLPPNTSDQERNDLINSLLTVLELTHRKDEIVKSFTNAISLSGGEQRRSSLAIQLLSKPSILFLDEPTTGLDTSTSLKLVRALRTLASPEFGITIVLSIHQPRPEISVLFDKLCLLTRGGRLVYYGNLVDSARYFSSESASLETIMNLSIKDTSSKEREKETADRINQLVSQWLERNPYPALTISDKEQKQLFRRNMHRFERATTDRISFWHELNTLTRRTFVISYRDLGSLLLLNVGALVLATMCGWLFYKPKADLAGVRSLTSSLYVMLEVVGFAPMFIEIERLWTHDGVNFFREYNERYLSIFGFILSRRLAKFLLEDLPVSIFFASISYFMWGLRMGQNFDDSGNGKYFGIYFAVTLLTELLGMLGAFVSFAISPDSTFSVIVTNIFYQIQNSACGYFVNAATMPVYVRWTKYIAFFWYAFGALTSNQYTDWMGDCPAGLPCTEYSGNHQLEVLGFPQNWIGEPIGILVAWIVAFVLISFVGLRFRNYDVEVAKTRSNKIGEEEEDQGLKDEGIVSPLSEDYLSSSTSYGFTLQNLFLSVKIKDSFTKSSDRVLLDSVNCSFQPNDVNVIMGPSGSGKTTLLSYLASRLPKTSKFTPAGTIELNGVQAISPNELARISAFVTQHDHSLIPRLTVRETLYYQARLRLPIEEHDRIPAIINRLIRQLALVDCADTLVGSEVIKGISGGEKRRVSIAIQLLSRPRVLFLDEPTSGLDSSTSEVILSLLHSLATENNTTVILTIHQPSEKMFDSFDRVLLLARGGKVIFDGTPCKIRKYFADLNYPVPANVNMADHVLDVITANCDELQESLNARVLTIVQTWATRHPASSIEFKGDAQVLDFNTVTSDSNLPAWVKFSTITKRSFVNSFRSTDVLMARAFQITVLAIVHSLYFAPLRNSEEGISNRLGLVQEVLNIYFVGLVNNITLYPVERDIFYQEYKDRIYGVAEFSLSYLLNEVPIELASCLFFSVMIVFVVGLPRNAGMFFGMFFSCFVSVNAGDSLGIFVNSVFNHLGLATNFLSNIIMLAIFMGGTMSLHMPPFFQAWNWLNPMKYAVGITAKLGFTNQTFDCSVDGCLLDSGALVLEYYNLDNNLAVQFAALTACLVIYRALAILSLYVRVKWFV